MSANGQTRFTLGSYLWDRLGSIAAWAAAAGGAGIMTAVLGATAQGACVTAAFVATMGLAATAGGYLRRRSFYRQLQGCEESLEAAYHLASLVDRPGFLEGRLLYDSCCDVCNASGTMIAQEQERMRALQRFVDLWTHEIKTPIAAAKLTLARMRGQDANSLKLDLERIEASCERALYTTRIGLVSGDYVLEEVQLGALCREACKSLSHLLISSGVTPVFKLGEDDRAFADASWMKFVLRQLVGNCAKYGASTITFSSWVENPCTPQGCVVLQVADDGIGIPADEVPRVFQRGFCGSNGRAEGSATGMGLYLSAQLCEALGVNISIASEEGCGTRVLIAFPCDASQLDAHAAAHAGAARQS